jgi:hypothetical protein
MSNIWPAQHRAGRSVYAVTWTLSELETPIDRYAECIAWSRPAERSADRHQRVVRCYNGSSAVGVYLHIHAEDLKTAIEISRDCVLGPLERAGLRSPRTVMVVGSLFSVTL